MALYSSHRDEELMLLLKKGDRAAFTEIYNRYWKPLTAIAYNYSQDQSTAKEIVQDLFVGIWNRRKVIEVQNLRSYLATAAKFSIFKRIERERRRRSIELREFEPVGYAPSDEQIELKFLQDFVNGIVEELPEKCRLVFSYSRLQHMTNTEIAQKMNISEKTVEGHLTKGLKVIRLHLKESGLLTVALGSFVQHWLK
jgi:RNA polymerase sigma-70 factor (family 1)